MAGKSRAFGPILTILCIFLTSGILCIVPVTPDGQPLQMRLANSSDTLSPFAPILLVFTEPVVQDSIVRFSFDPIHESFYTILNKSGDTVTLHLSEPLHGQARYTIRLETDIQSKTGKEMLRGVDSLVFYTYTIEEEPNNNRSLSDSIQNRVFGAISTTDDTDWYIVDDSTVRSIYLHSTESQQVFALYDSSVTRQFQSTFALRDTQSVPIQISFPIYIVISSHNRSAGGYYELGLID